LLDEKASRLHGEFGVRLSAIFFTEAEAKSRKNAHLFKKIVKEGKLLVGRKMEDIVGS